MKKIWVSLALFAIMLIATSIPMKGDTESGEIRATVIIEFGNHEDMSYTVILPQDNHTALKATELACENLSLYFHWCSGGFVDQIGWEKNDWYNSGYYWHLLVWENDSYGWKMSTVGASSLNLSDGDCIAWIYSVDDISWQPWTMPAEIVGHYTSFSSMRGNLNNTGEEDAYILGNNILWKFKSQSSWGFSSTPIFYRGFIFIADSSNLYALNANGSLIWNNSKGAAGAWGISSPTAFGDYVIIGTSDKYIRAFYINNGTIAWEHYIGEDVASSPVVDIVDKYPVVFVATFNFNSNGNLYALNLTDGKELWNLTLMGSNYLGMPAISNGKIYVPIAGIEDSNYNWNPPYGIQCIDEHGNYLWNLSIDSSIRSSPVIKDDTIYFVTAGGNLSTVDLTSHTFKWNYTIGSSTSSPAIHGNVLYVANDDGDVYAIEDDGNYAKKLWHKKVNGTVKASVLYAHGKIAVVTDTSSSEVYVFSADGHELWNYTPKPANYILSSPIIADSLLLIASNNGYLYALTDNSSLPKIEDIEISNAYVNSTIKISFSSGEEYQAILFYRNDTEDKYHAIWMSYQNGRYVGYIPPQKEGKVYFYISVVSPTGEMRTTSIHEFSVINPIPELTFLPVLIFALISIILIISVILNRVRD